MRKLMVPVDGSDKALRALGYAIKLAQEHGSTKIHVVTAHDEPDIYGEIAVYVPREKMADLQQRIGQSRLGPAEQILKDAGVPYEAEILIGDTATMIALRADELGCEAIVMATRGMTAIGGLVMGSIATKVVHAANVPVTLVK